MLTTRAFWWVTKITTPSSAGPELPPPSLKRTPPIMLLRPPAEADAYAPCAEEPAINPYNSSTTKGEADNTTPFFCPSNRRYEEKKIIINKRRLHIS